MNDIIINKIQSIQRCVQRAREEYTNAGGSFNTDYTRQDAAILNILRACEQVIDLANHIIKTHHMGIPTSTVESFTLLAKKKVIDSELAERLADMVQFRNKVVHEYQRIKIAIVNEVLNEGINDLLEFAEKIRMYSGATS